MQIRILWWNTQDFAHFDPARAGEVRWPSSAAEFNAKVQLLATVVREFADAKGPVIIALAETTKLAAEALRDRLLPSYKVFSLDMLPRADLHVAIIYPPDSWYSIEEPFAASYVPRNTRPMAVLDIHWRTDRIRIIAGHWTARFTEASEKTRSDTARELSRYIFDFLDSAPSSEERHAIVVGDLNEEPFGILERDLFAHRERGRAQRTHWADRDVKRRYLYNVSWQFLGERVPALTSRFDSAGTYYWHGPNEWRTFDHIIVDGSLVAERYPRIDEMATSVLIHDELYRAGNVPSKFWWNGHAATGGISDHLPLVTVLHLEKPK